MHKLVIVDDEQIIVNGLTNILNWQGMGIEIVAATTSSKEALAIIKQENVDILITDVNMPEYSGVELLKEIQGNELRIRTIVLSGYDDFSYVKQCFLYGADNYLLKPIDAKELELQIKKIQKALEHNKRNELLLKRDLTLLKQQLLQRVLLGNSDSEEISRYSEKTGLNFDYKYFTIAISKFNTIVSEKENKAEEIRIDDIILRMQEQMQEQMQEKCKKISLNNSPIQVEFTSIMNNEVIYLIELQDKPMDEQQDLSELLHKVIDHSIDRNVMNHFTVIGSVVDFVKRISKSYADAKKLQGYELIMKDNSIVCYESIIRDKNEEKSKLSLNLSDMGELLLNRNEEEVIKEISWRFQAIKNCEDLTPEECKSIIMQIIFYLFGSMGTLGISQVEEGKNKYLLLELLSYHKLDLIEAKLKELSLKYIQMQNETVNMHPTIVQVIRYIREHYEEELSLNLVADMYGVNVKYLGHLFKQQTGVYFSDYLCNYRIEIAKNLLVTTTLKSFDVSLKVGFADASYFSNVFKKKVGMYPSKYRQLKGTEV